MSALKTYEVTVLFDACKGVTVQAATPEEAEKQAIDHLGSPCLCHQCTDEVEVGDALGAIVYEGSREVLDSTMAADNLRKMTAQRDELLATLQQIARGEYAEGEEQQMASAAIAKATGGAA